MLRNGTLNTKGGLFLTRDDVIRDLAEREAAREAATHVRIEQRPLQRNGGLSGKERPRSVCLRRIKWNEHELLMRSGCPREVDVRRSAGYPVRGEGPLRDSVHSGYRGNNSKYNQILASLRFASTEERVTRSSQKNETWLESVQGGHFLFIFICI